MNLLLRLAGVLFDLRRRGRLAPLDESVVSFRVLPNDLDINLHLNNGRYLSLMDLGRLDMMGRMGALPLLLKRRWNPVVGSLTIRFRRSVEPFQRYQLHSRILAWDEKWFYIEQRFVREGELLAIALVKGLFLGGGERIPPQQVIDLLYPGFTSPEIPPSVVEWQQAEERLRFPAET